MARRDRTSKKKQQSSLSKTTTLPSSRPFLANTDPLETVITPKTDTSTTSFNLSQIDFDETAKSHPTTDFAPIQPKLTIGEPGDKYEQEADNVAKVVVQQINSPQAQHNDEIQRSSMTSLIQRQDSIQAGTASNEFESNLNSARSGGSTLEPVIKGQMESAIGANFSEVKVHTDHQADQLSRSIQAKAFTTGQDVFFKQGEYNPNSRSGQELLAHELTHVVQQSGSAKVQRMHHSQESNVTVSSTKSTAIQRVEEEEATKLVSKYVKTLGMSKRRRPFMEKQLKAGITRLAKLQDQTYEDYIANLSISDFNETCEYIYKTEGQLSLDEKEDMKEDIVVPQSYYHVTSSFNQISGLMTGGAGPCTALAMSAANEDGDCVYAVAHIDAENSISTVVDGMVEDMAAQLNESSLLIKAYISSGDGVGKNGTLSATPKDVVAYLKQQKINLVFTSNSTDIRVGGESVDDDLVRTSGGVSALHSGCGNKSVDGLIKQIEAMPQMKGGHGNWEELTNTSDYRSGKHDPMEGIIKAVLERSQVLESEVGNDEDKLQAITTLKEAIVSCETWYTNYAFGKTLLTWA